MQRESLNGSNDVLPPKDDPISCLDDEWRHMGKIMPQKLPKIGAWIGNFKPKRQNLYIAMICSELLIRQTSDLKTEFRPGKALRGWSAITQKQIQHGWPPPSWKSIWRHNSAVHGPIWIKFGTLMKNNTFTAKWSRSKPEVEFQNGGRLFFQTGRYLSRELRYVDEIWFADKLWCSEGSDVNKYETRSSIDRPRPPSWEMDMTSYFRSGCSDLDKIR